MCTLLAYFWRMDHCENFGTLLLCVVTALYLNGSQSPILKFNNDLWLCPLLNATKFDHNRWVSPVNKFDCNFLSYLMKEDSRQGCFVWIFCCGTRFLSWGSFCSWECWEAHTCMVKVTCSGSLPPAPFLNCSCKYLAVQCLYLCWFKWEIKLRR